MEKMDKYRKRFAKIILPALMAVCLIVMSGCSRSAEDAAAPVQDTPLPVITVEESAPEPESVTSDKTSEDAGESQVLDPASSFYAEDISDEVFARMEGRSFPAKCTVSRDDLKYLHLLYKDIDGNTREGEMVCNAAIADKLVDIFRQLYESSYPIERMSLVDDYDADDDASMAANNTSCFNFRFVTGTNKISKHGYGMAVDLNPRYNPYIYTRDGVQHIEPENGVEYADRSNDFDYKIDKDDLAYKLFTQAGFTWGGSWKNSKDYQHFQMD